MNALRSPHRRLVLLVVPATFAALAVVACQDPTQIVFTITTDVPCARLDSTEIAVGAVGDVEGKPSAAASTQCIDGKIGSLVVVPSGANDEEIAVRVVTGVGKSAEDCERGGLTGGCIVARRALRFAPHATLRVAVEMRASCIDVVCSNQGFATCVKGACVAAHVDTAACSGSGCDEGALGAPVAPPAADAGTPDASDASDAARADDAGALADAGADAGSSAGGGTWIPIAASPVEGRSHMSGVWTGKEVLVFAGETATSYAHDGVHFDPAQNRYTQVIPDYPFNGETHHDASVVWADTVRRAIYWGGWDGSRSFNTGALYSPDDATWYPMKAAPSTFLGRHGHAAVWTGHEMIVWGGDSVTSGAVNDGAAYDPATDSWRILPGGDLSVRYGVAAVWDGTAMQVWGGRDSGYPNDGQGYVPDPNGGPGAWAAPFIPPAVLGRGWPVALAVPRAGMRALSIFFGGGDVNNGLATGNGFTLDPDNTSAPMKLIPSVSPQILAARDRIETFTWVGRGRLWTFGGLAYDSVANTWTIRGDGASYDLAGGTWASMPAPPPNAAVSRTAGVTVWTGDRAVLLGGEAPLGGDAGGTRQLADGWMFVPQ